MTEAEVEEKNAQEEYEKTMKEAAVKRADDTKVATTKELMATDQYISSLHGECDWLLQYFDVRKEARDGEIDALGKAKAVLSGADFSLLQTSAKAQVFLHRRQAPEDELAKEM